MAPYQQQVLGVMSIPGVDRITVWHLMAELGPDMSLFPDANHLRQLGGGESGELGERGQAVERTDQEGVQISAAHLGPSGLGGFALQAGVSAGLLLSDQGEAWVGEGDVAVAHKILVTAYNILKTGPPYQDLGSDYFDNLHPERTTHRLVQRLERLGHSVVLEILPPANPQIP
jgi:transposase